MTIKTDEIGRRIVIELNPADFFLKKIDPKKDKELSWCGEYCLSVRIDMDYAGKPDQEGMPVIFLTEEQAEKVRPLIAVI